MNSPEVDGSVSIGEGCTFGPGVRLVAGRFGKIKIGRRCNLKAGLIIACYGGSIEIGDRVSLGEYTVLYGHGGIVLEDYVAIGPHCTFTSQEHIVGSKIALRFSGERNASVRVETGAIISAGCVLTAGVTVGSRTLVGAGSVVLDPIPAACVAFGTPCRIQMPVVRNPLYGSEA